MKKVRKHFVKKQVILLLCGCLFIGCIGITGCTAVEAGENDTKIVLTTGFEKNEVFRIEKYSCMLPEVMVYLTNTQNQYEKIYGKEIWDTVYEGVTMEENIKDTVLARIAKVKAMNLLAVEKQIELDNEEQEKAKNAAKEYYNTLNDTEKELLDIDEQLICAMYNEYALAQKVYEHLIADINPEISDDEARTITVQSILIKTYTLNENGEKVPYSDTAKQQAYKKALEVQRRAASGEDFTSLIVEYNEDVSSTYSFGKGNQESAFEEASFNLGTDEISGVVETIEGYYIIKCISTFDRDETDRNKIKIVEQRRKEVFNQEYSDFVEELTKNINSKLWEKITFIENEHVTTNSFFEIYQKYFEIE